MAKRSKKPSDISLEDWVSVDVPEATDAEFAAAKPFKEVFPSANGRRAEKMSSGAVAKDRF
jgi:hypothetical protein